ncbi:VWA domain-containing protein, partial [Candidatus Woesearchaeota archaeon]|nr:VWA domain-containing protein [Candidatus Woesearchaeota archaeon]
MHQVLELLDRAEGTWRDAIRTEFPIFAQIPVEKAQPNPQHKRHWQFYTDNEIIHMDIFKPEEVESLFEKVVKELYRDAYGIAIDDDTTLVQRLIQDTLTYLHFHETFHPAITPDSKQDEKVFDEALYQGMKHAEPRISEADALHKVGNVRNAVWDVIIDDVFFYLSNYDNNLERRLRRIMEEQHDIALPNIPHLPDGVVPIFDTLEIHLSEKEGKKPRFQSLFYPITRLMYGMLFTREAKMRKKLVDFFKSALDELITEEELRIAITGALKGVVHELDPQQGKLARVDRKAYEAAVDRLYEEHDNPEVDAQHRYVIDIFTKILSDKRTRYAAVRGFIQPLAKYISLEREEKRHGTHIAEDQGEQDEQSSINQAGGNMQQALLNLADALGEQSNPLLSEVANNPSGSLGGQATREKKLGLLAMDEYYKRNAKEIPIRSPRQEAIEVDLGTRQQWKKVETNYIRTENLHHLPLEEILRFQQQTGIIQLFWLSPQEWQYDIYELEETQETDYTFENVGLELPDNVVFHLDSSGSMGSPKYVGTGSKYDQLMHVVYGILKNMRKAADQMKKDVNIVTANFSNGTFVSKPAELRHLYDTPFNDGKQAVLGFQNGGTVYDADALEKIQKLLVPGKTVHVWVTDGGLESSCIQAVERGIEKLVQDPNTMLLYFEIGGASSFGAWIKQLERQRP